MDCCIINGDVTYLGVDCTRQSQNRGFLPKLLSSRWSNHDTIPSQRLDVKEMPTMRWPQHFSK
eukprot:scaffold19122_cov162-Skeletonema_marinoi.AAC.9